MLKTFVHRAGSILLLSGLAFAPLVGGCKKDLSKTGEVAQQSQGNYAEAYNLLIDDPDEMLEEYFKQIPEDGPVEGKKYSLFPRQKFAESKIADAKKAIAAAKRGAPASLAKTGPLADAALVGVEKVFKTFDAAQKYYDAENFKDDKSAKGKSLHTEMVAATKEYRLALSAFGDVLDEVEDAQMATEVQKYKPTSAGYWFRFANMSAKKLLGVVKKDMSPTYAKEVETAVAEFEKVKEGVTKFVTDNGAGLGVAQSSYKNYQDQVESIFASATKVKRAAAEFDKADEKGKERAASDIESEVKSVIGDYNNLVSSAKSMYELEASGALK
jgi:hypothetical protein